MDTKADSTNTHCGMEQEEPKKVKRVFSPVKRFDLKDMIAKVTCYFFRCSFKALVLCTSINTLYSGKTFVLIYILGGSKVWELVEKGQECNENNDQKHILHTEEVGIVSVNDCAAKCKLTKATMFAFGTLDYGKPGCNDKGCQCICEIFASEDGTCTKISNVAVHLYRYKTPGNHFTL